MIQQVDWYTDFYYPFLKRWTERVRGAVANGRGHEKLFFAGSIPNEVWRRHFALDSCHLAHDRASFVHHHGRHNTNFQTWYLHPTG